MTSGAGRVEDAVEEVCRPEITTLRGLELARRRRADRAVMGPECRARSVPWTAAARAGGTARGTVVPRVGAGGRLGRRRVRGLRAPARSCNRKAGHHDRQCEERDATGRHAGVARRSLRLNHSGPRSATHVPWEAENRIVARSLVKTASHRLINQPTAPAHSRLCRARSWSLPSRPRVSPHRLLPQPAPCPPRALTARPPPPRMRKIRACTAVRTWIGSAVKAKTANASPRSRISP